MVLRRQLLLAHQTALLLLRMAVCGLALKSRVALSALTIPQLQPRLVLAPAMTLLRLWRQLQPSAEAMVLFSLAMICGERRKVAHLRLQMLTQPARPLDRYFPRRPLAEPRLQQWRLLPQLRQSPSMATKPIRT